MNTAGNFFQSVRSMIHSIHSSHNGKQYLRCTYVGSRLFTTDMLLASLKRHPIAVITRRIYRGADNSARHLSFKIILYGKESSMGTAKSHRHPKSLAGAE